jgi:RNA polymerase sigma factor (sigma-70 family)
MAHAAIDQFVLPLCHRQGLGAAGDADRDLLERFAAGGDEAAFAALVRRHGPMVRGLCRRLLGDPGRADDVFQATFLVLARRPGSIRRRASVGGWLYGVARRLAHKAQRGEARRRRHERRAAEGRLRAPTPGAGWAELLAILDEELERLPEQARAPLLLCYLEGCTQDEAARFLGWSLGTLRRRLEWGRDLLRLRLTRRGATLSAGLFAALLAPRAATAAVPDCLAGDVARAAVAFAAGRAPDSAAAALAQAACSTLGARTRKAVALLILTAGAVLAGAGGWAYRSANDLPPEPRPPAPQAPEGKPVAPTALTDRLGDPLPEGALVRFGSTRFRHPGGITNAALAPDGTVIATEGAGVLRLIDVATGRVRLTRKDPQFPEGHNDGMRVLAFSPDSKLLLAPGNAGLRLLDPATGKEMRRLGGSQGSTRGLAFSPDGKQIAVAGNGATFYDTATGRERLHIPLAGQWMAWWLAYGPDGCRVALPGTTSQDVRFCDTATGKEFGSFSSGSDVMTVAFAPDGKTLAVAGKDDAVRLWDVATCKAVHVLPEKPAEPGRDHVSALVFAPDGKVLTVGTGDDSIHLWDPATGRALRRLRGHTWMVTGLFFTGDGKTLLSTSWDGTVRRWDVASGREVRGPETDLDQAQMARSADGRLVATAGADGTITLWEAATGRRLRVLEGHRRGLFALAFSPDGRRLASGGWEEAVRLWDVAGGKEVQSLPCAADPQKKDRVEALAFSPDGRLLAACDRHQDVVRLWDMATGREVRQVASGRRDVALAFAPDGRTLATGGWDHNPVLWDVATGRQLRTMQPDRDGSDAVDAIAFSPDGHLIATGHHGESVYLWDAATGKPVRQIKAAHVVTWCLAFSPDGRWLATGGLDAMVSLWEVATGRRLHRLRGHAFWVLRLAFGPDGRTLTTGGYDGTSLLWTLKPKLEPLPAAGALPLWQALREQDAERAYRAAWALAEHPGQSIPFLKEHLRPARPPVDRDRLRQWLADLDSDEFRKRDTASRELAKLGAAIEPDLRAALANTQSQEARRRLEALLEDVQGQLSPEVLRRGRAVQVLELIGNRDAVELLTALAKEPEDESLRREAGAALARLRRSGGGR